jgi:hypothetical protein
MAGGLLNLISEGNPNIILNGNPSKTFWKAKYAKYTNFGKQNFRIDHEGSRSLRINEESTFTFKIKRYAELLMDSYISINLPNIWSPIMQPKEVTDENNTFTTNWAPYEFKWIDHLGAQMIKKISITCGNQTLQEYTGQYILAMAQRDFSKQKLELFERMIGHVPELNDPANAGAHVNTYPSCYYTENILGVQPSIMGRTIYVPLSSWFTLKPQNALPLISLQYNEINITVTFRPISQLFRIRDVDDYENNFPYVSPNLNRDTMQFYRFLQTPPDISLNIDSYSDKRMLWNSDVHLNCTYAFLSDDEALIFSKNEQKYLITQPSEREFLNVTGNNKIQLDSLGMVKSWLFFFRRSDVNLRNEWSNYTNWPYNYLPFDSYPAIEELGYYYNSDNTNIGPGINIDKSLTNLFINPVYNPINIKNILKNMGILMDGQYRENVLSSDVFNYIEKYTRTAGNAPDGLYCYNFCLDTSPYNLQPSGAINMTKFKSIDLEFSTIEPPLSPFAQVKTICDGDGNIIGINKPTWGIYEYNYDMVLFEEKINLLTFVGGNVSVLFAN